MGGSNIDEVLFDIEGNWELEFNMVLATKSKMLKQAAVYDVIQFSPSLEDVICMEKQGFNLLLFWLKQI